MKKLITILLLLITLAGCATGNIVKEEEIIKIGGMFSLSGKLAFLGESESNFAKIAIDEINANGGINGKQIEFILEDDRCSAIDSVSAFNKLVLEEIDFILGPGCTTASAPIAPLAEMNQKFILSATTTTADLYDDYKFAFRVSPEGTEAARKIGMLAAKKYDLKRAAIILEQSDFAQSWSDGFVEGFEANGGNVVSIQKFTTGTKDFKTIIAKIKEMDVDSIFISGQSPDEATQTLKELEEFGLLDDLHVMGNPTMIDTVTDDLSGGLLPEDAFTVLASIENDELLQKYISRFGKEPSFQLFYTASLYDAVYMLKEAIEACEEEVECVRDYFEHDLVYDGIVKWSFNEDGDPVVEGLYKELNIVNGKSIFTSI